MKKNKNNHLCIVYFKEGTLKDEVGTTVIKTLKKSLLTTKRSSTFGFLKNDNGEVEYFNSMYTAPLGHIVNGLAIVGAGFLITVAKRKYDENKQVEIHDKSEQEDTVPIENRINDWWKINFSDFFF